MAFENIGIGGVLRFDIRGAVANMNVAGRAFNNVRTSADKLSVSVGKIGSGLAGLSIGGGLTALAGGLTIGGLVREGVQFNAQMQSGRLAIATILSAVTKTPLNENIDKAANAMDRLNVLAAQAPGEVGDLVNIFQLLTGPMTSAGADMETILQNTKGTAILAGVLKRSYQDTGSAIAKLQAGTIESGNDIIIMLKSMGLLTESTEEWREMLPEDRLKRVNQIMATFKESGDRVGETFEAQASTVKSLGKIILGAFTEKLFASMTKHMGALAKKFYDNEKAIMATARALGETFGNAIQFVSEQLFEVARLAHEMFTAARARVYDFMGALDRLGLSIDKQILGKIIFTTGAIGTMALALGPVMMIFGAIASKVMAIFSIVSGLVGALGAVASLVAPLAGTLATVGMIFLAFRKAGEGPMNTINRGLVFARTNLNEIWASIGPGIKVIFAALQRFAIVLRDVFIGQILSHVRIVITMMVDQFRTMVRVLKPIFDLAAKTFARVLDVVGPVLAKVIAAVLPMFRALMKIRMAIQLGLVQAFVALKPAIEIVIGLFMLILEIAMWAVGKIAWAVENIMVPVIEGAAWVLNKIIDVLIAIVDGVMWVVDVVRGVFAAAWNFLGDVVKTIGGVINDYIVEPIKRVIGMLSDAVGWIGDTVGAVGSAVAGAANAVGTAASDAASYGVSKLGDAVGFLGQTLGLVEKEQKNGETWSQMMWKMGMSAEEYEMRVNSLKATLFALRDVAVATYNSLKGIATATLGAFSGPSVENQITTTNITDKRQEIAVQVGVTNKTDLCIDGRKVASATQRHETEIMERSGFSNTPWQTRRAQVSGVGGK